MKEIAEEKSANSCKKRLEDEEKIRSNTMVKRGIKIVIDNRLKLFDVASISKKIFEFNKNLNKRKEKINIKQSFIWLIYWVKFRVFIESIKSDIGWNKINNLISFF